MKNLVISTYHLGLMLLLYLFIQLFIVIFTFLDNKREDKTFRIAW
jgi:hypothetical protein